MQKQITVAIITRNRDKLLAKCLASLEKQTLKCSELLVVDNASKDQTRNVVKQFRKVLPIHYVYESRIGIPFARNRALEEAGGEILAFIDDDCEATPNWIEEMAKAHAKYPKAAAIQGRLDVLDPKSIFGIVSQRTYDSWLRLNLMGENRISMVNTSNVSFKKNLLQKHNIAFDTRFYRFYCGEDTDIALQLLAKHQDLVNVNAVRVLFTPKTTLWAFLNKRFRISAANTALMYKWPGIFPPSRKAPDQFITQNVVLNWLERTLLGIVYAFSKRAYLSGKIIEEVRILQTQLLHKNSSSNEKRKQMLFLAAGIIRQCHEATFPLYLKLLGSRGLYLLIAFFFLQRNERQSLEIFISQRKSLRPNNTNRSVSVAVVTRNRVSLLYGCLSSLSRQTVFPKEVIVIDNGSSDETKEIALSFQQILPLRYLKEPQIGIPFARNRALKEAKGEILAFLDDDCEATQNWVEEIVKAHKKYPMTVAIQGMSKNIKTGSIFYLLWLKRNMIIDRSLVVLDTKNVSFKKSLLKKLAITFDSNFAWGSEVDFAKQIREKKRQIAYVREVYVYHRKQTNIFDFIEQAKAIGESQAKLEFKWKRRISPQSVAFRLEYEKAIKEIGNTFPFLQRWIITSINALYIFIYKKSLKKTSKDVGVLKNILPVARDKSLAFTIAIVTHNRHRLLEKCLFSLSKQSVIPKEVLVIDNGSTDKTKTVASSFSKVLPIRYIFERTIGIPYARNRALKEAKGDILAFIDDDCEATQNWVEEMIKAHQKNPKAAAIQGYALSQPHGSIFSIIWQNLYDSWIKKNTLVKNRLFIIDSKNVSFKRLILKKAKLEFDVIFNRGSDVDFAKQLIAQNLEIVYYLYAVIYHSERRNVFSFIYQKYQTGRSQAKFEAKWPSSFFPKTTQKHANSYKKMFNGIGVNLPILRRLVLKILLALYIRAYKIGYLSIKNSTPWNVTQAASQIKREKHSSNIISVAIVTRNRYSQLKECLNSFIKQTVYPKEIIVIDNASTDLTREIINSFKNLLPITYFYESRIGIPFARNRALKETQGEILAFLDDDCKATPNWVEEMSKAHQKYPKAAAIQGKSYALPKSNIFSVVSQEFHHHWLNQNLIGQNRLAILDTRNVSLKVSELKNANISFDNSLNHVEDADLGRQLLVNNKIIIYYPNAEILFLARTNLIQFLKHRFWVGVYNIHLEQKWLNNFISKDSKRKLYLNQKQLLNIRSYEYPVYALIKIIAKIAYNLGQISETLRVYYSYQRLSKEAILIKDDPKPQHKFKLSVMLITKDRPRLLMRCLLSLTKQTRKPDEVIIVDSSKNQNLPFIDGFKRRLQISYIYEERLGFGVARNTALKEAAGHLIATLDDDEEASPDWCERIIAAHKQFPEAVAIQGRIICKPISFYAIVEQMRLDRWFLNSLQFNGLINTISTKNVSFKKTILKRFDIRFREDHLYGKFGSEDIDIANQLTLHNLLIIYIPGVFVYHWERSNLIDYLKQQYRKGKSRALIKRDWDELEEKKKQHSLPRFSQIADVFMHPLGKKKILITPFLFLTYVLSAYFYNKGLKDFTRLLKDDYALKLHTETVSASLTQKESSFIMVNVTQNRANTSNK